MNSAACELLDCSAPVYLVVHRGAPSTKRSQPSKCLAAEVWRLDAIFSPLWRVAPTA